MKNAWPFPAIALDVIWVTGLGALGGAINAGPLYAGIALLYGQRDFEWSYIPAGACHGGLLALVAARCAVALRNRHVALRVAAAPCVGWLSGYLSFIPFYAVEWRHPPTGDLILMWVQWPWGGLAGPPSYAPLRAFGTVGMLLYLWIVLGSFRASGLRRQIAAAVVAGVVGSAWWWFSWEPWFLCMVHGPVWGVLVGLGLWRWARRERGTPPTGPAQA